MKVILLSDGFQPKSAYFQRAFNKCQSACGEPAFRELSTKVDLRSESFQRNSARFWKALNEIQAVFGELSTKVSLLLESFQKKLACFLMIFVAIYQRSNLLLICTF